METKIDLPNFARSRRNFLAGAGALGAAAVITGCSSSGTTAPPPAPTPTPNPTDVDILNFALNLEYLEAEFYLRAATGKGLATADIGVKPGAVTGGLQVPNLTPTQQNILNEIAYDEQAHVQFLRKALGSAAVDRPAIDLTFFGPLATAAKIPGTFNPFGDFYSFLVGAFVFEDVGVTAYHGAAPALTDSGHLSAAAGILAVEAYHAAYVRTALTGIAINMAATKTPFPYFDDANLVSALRGTLGGGNETPLVLPSSVSMPSAIVAADTTNAIAFSRTTDQVLHIVYGAAAGPSVKSGGFFPNGLNGTITVTSA